MTIRFNTDFRRWEVYGETVIRGGKPQPCFVSDSYSRCLNYIAKVEKRNGAYSDTCLSLR